MMKLQVAKYAFWAFGQAIKAARKSKGISRNQLADQMHSSVCCDSGILCLSTMWLIIELVLGGKL